MKIVFTPDWFLTSDIFINLFSFIVLAFVCTLAFKSYRMSEKKSSLYLGLGFLLIALAELATVITKLPIYYDFSPIKDIGTAIVTNDIVSTIDIFYYIGFFFSRLFTLLGLYILYKLPAERISGEFFLYIYFITIISILGQPFYFIHHFTALILLVFIVNKYTKIYLKERAKNTRTLVVAFVLLAIGQWVFLFSKVGAIYVLGQIIQLTGYITLLMLIIKIIKDGKKEKPRGNHSRHA
ncbi:hypothetical protein HYT25_00800 [Candidatus Pacearchaeota archaeon]|nr:hypothetical protein [Candidatus Pacearchaeota archaeon]